MLTINLSEACFVFVFVFVFESLDPWAGRVGGTNKQASKLPRSMALGSLSYDQQ